MSSKKAMLIIMDGWGLGQVKDSDAIQNANVPYVSSLYATVPNTTLVTFGTQVGLPEGQMGNSEVGHLNLGAGRIVYQDLERINVAIRTGTFEQNEALLATINYAKTNAKKLHVIGLVSDGGVHAHINHVKAIATVCANHGVANMLVHAFTDGRDTDPKSGRHFIADLQKHLDITGGVLATVTGRYYAMDRDNRWERVKIAYDVLVNGKGTPTNNFVEAIDASYAAGVTDEFLMPLINSDVVNTLVEDGDAVIMFNYRTDRCREITEALTQQAFPEQNMHPLNLFYTTMTKYDSSFTGVHVMYEKDDLKNTLGEVLSAHGKTQVRIAETEKYPHVSFFFSGGREMQFNGESRIMVPSPKVATYDLQPEMSAAIVTDKIIDEIDTNQPDFVCLNFANADMVGHTGVWPAVIKAVETVDHCVKQVVETALKYNYTVFLTADHGNADFEINDDGTPNTAHTTNPVPLFVIDNGWKGEIQPGKLGDIAPSILYVMGLPQPPEMTGTILVS